MLTYLNAMRLISCLVFLLTWSKVYFFFNSVSSRSSRHYILQGRYAFVNFDKSILLIELDARIEETYCLKAHVFQASCGLMKQNPTHNVKNFQP